MKRWALLVAILYGAIMCLLLPPTYHLAFASQPRSANHGIFFHQWWLLLAVMSLAQGALLAVPVRVASRRPVTRRPLAMTIGAGALMMSALVVGAFCSIYEFGFHEAGGHWTIWTALSLGLGAWCVWGWIFFRMSRRLETGDFVSRICRWLFTGSILELLIAVPTHIVARYRDYCCAGVMTFIGLTMGMSVMLFSFGPGVFFLFAARWRRLHPGATNGAESNIQRSILVKSMKKLLHRFVSGACACLVLPCLVIFGIRDNALAQPSASGPSAQLNSANPTTTPVTVPEPGPKAVSFYHSTILLIAVIVVWSLLIPVGFLFTGFSARLRSWAERPGRKWYFSYAIYFTAFSLIYFLLLLPLVFYGGFVRPHHYDLSNQSFARWLYCTVQGAAIELAGGLAAGWIPFFIIRKSPRRWWLYLGLLAPLYLCFTLWIQPVLIDPLYRRFTTLQDRALEAKILAEATRAGIQVSRVYQVNMSVDTKVEDAYVTGFMGTKRIVFYDTALQNMNQDELLFILGHEMGHYVLRHVAKLIAFESVLILVSLYVAYLLAGPVIGRFRNIWGFATPSDFAAMPLGGLAFWLFCFVGVPIDMAFSRHIEHEADRFGLELTHENHAAATAFVRLMQVDLGVARPGAILMVWFGSHPCIADRIEFCNTYHPWETRQPSKYEQYMKP